MPVEGNMTVSSNVAATPGGADASPGTSEADVGLFISDGPIALSVRDVEVRYGNVIAVHEASFDVATGECLAVVGPNGNGKSSIVMSIVGLVPRRGEVTLFGEVAPPDDVMWTARRGLTLVPERRQLYPGLSVADNIVLGCHPWTRSLKKARTSDAFVRAIDLFPELQDRMKQKAGTLSGGQQQMVAMARGLASNPKVLAVDEPCLGLAEVVAHRVYDTLARIIDEGTTLILVEEVPDQALELSDRIVEVRNGQVS
jgi:branched-chain amino acid transport system ATP-binding protein